MYRAHDGNIFREKKKHKIKHILHYTFEQTH